jgi:hypothetical protein
MSMKNSNHTIGNRASHLPACSAVPQATAPPRAPVKFVLTGKKKKYIYMNIRIPFHFSKFQLKIIKYDVFYPPAFQLIHIIF